MKRFAAAWAALWLTLLGAVGAPALAQAPAAVSTGTLRASRADPCPQAIVCGDLLAGRFKGGGVLTSAFQGLPNLTVTRASFAYGENADGSLKGFQAGQARTTSKGLGVFEATTNLLWWSQDLTQAAAWVSVNATATARTAIAPDGTLTANTITNNGGLGWSRVRQGLTTVVSTTYTATVYVKQGTTRYAAVTWGEPTSFDAFIDLQSCATSNVAAGITVTCEQKANGWERVILVRAAGTTGITFNIAPATASGSLNSALNDNILVWGADVRVGAYAVPYCPSLAGSTATCAADQVTLGTSLGAAVSVFTEYSADANSRDAISTAPAAVGTYLAIDAGNAASATGWWASGLNAGPTFTGVNRTAFSESGSAFRVYRNGAVLTTSTGSDYTGSATSVVLGRGGSSGQLILNNYQRSFAVYGSVLSDAQLQGLTAGTDGSALSLNFASGLYKTTTPYVRTNYAWPSNDPTNANWTKVSATVALVGGAVCPADGVSPVYRVTASANNARLNVSAPIANIPVGAAYVVSSWVKTAANDVSVRAFDGGNGLFTSTTVTAGSSLNRVFATRTAAASATGPAFDLLIGTSGETADLCFTQVEPGSYPSSYIAAPLAATSVATTQSTNPADIGALTFTNASGGYGQFSNGTLQWFPANTPRITDQGVLVEEARTNSILWSQDPSNAAWNKNASGTGSAPVVSPNAALAPDGTMTAAQVVFNAGAGTTSGDQSVLAQNLTWTNGSSYAGGFWIKGPAGAQVMFRHAGANVYTCLTLTGAWQRASSVETGSGTSGAFGIGIRQAQACGTINATVTVFIWQIDFQAGAFLTSPIFTTSATATRPADVMSYGGQTPPSAFTLAAVGTMQSSAISGIASWNDGTANNKADLRANSGGSASAGTVGGVGSWGIGSGPLGLGSHAAALSVQASRVAYSSDGAAVASATPSAGIPTSANRILIGGLDGGIFQFNGYVSKVVVLPYAANDNELQYRAAGNF